MICSKSYQLWECYILMRELRITFSGYMENQAVRVRGFNKLNVSVLTGQLTDILLMPSWINKEIGLHLFCQRKTSELG